MVDSSLSSSLHATLSPLDGLILFSGDPPFSESVHLIQSRESVHSDILFPLFTLGNILVLLPELRLNILSIIAPTTINSSIHRRALKYGHYPTIEGLMVVANFGSLQLLTQKIKKISMVQIHLRYLSISILISILK
jgi:hypothetical protein